MFSFSFAINIKVVTLIWRCSSKRVDGNEILLKRFSVVSFSFSSCVLMCITSSDNYMVLMMVWPFRVSSEIKDKWRIHQQGIPYKFGLFKFFFVTVNFCCGWKFRSSSMCLLILCFAPMSVSLGLCKLQSLCWLRFI